MPKKIDLPPVWTLMGFFSIWILNKFMPILDLGSYLPRWVAWIVVVIGIVYIVWAIVLMRRADTAINPRGQPTELIKTGPFAVSRNPIYTGFALLLLAAALWQGGLSGFFIIPAFVWIINHRFIVKEEKKLLKIFPDAPEYFEKTRRW